MFKTLQARKKSRRGGTAIAELAICLPAIVVLVMGAIECCTMIFVKQSLHVAAYEAVRIAIKDEGTNTRVLNRCNRVLNERNVVDPQIALTPADIESVPRGTQVTVSVSAPCSSNSVLRAKFFTGNLTAEAVMVKE